MIRGLLAAWVPVAVVASWVLDRVLRWRADGAPPAAVSTSVVIDAPIERVWAVVADVEGQPRWMQDMKIGPDDHIGPIGRSAVAARRPSGCSASA